MPPATTIITTSLPATREEKYRRNLTSLSAALASPLANSARGASRYAPTPAPTTITSSPSPPPPTATTTTTIRLRTTNKRFSVEKVNNNVSYYYVNYDYPGLVWRNAIIFSVLHILYVYGFYFSVVHTSWSSWLFMYCYAVFGGLGITAGAHRLWSHRSYKARLPLRVFLMLCNCIAGQNDLIEWCRDHRLHHKSSETDADPHNSNRGWFFAHIGWLLQRKHPKVLEMGLKLDLSDLKRDPVLKFQKQYYWLLASIFGLALPVSICHLYFEEPLWPSLCVGVWRYVTSLHCTWFVNSAAHIWGSQDYDKHIEPRESCLVSIGALGEGFHNYHHTFPFDYSTSEHGGYFNFTTIFIDLMCLLGLAYDLRVVSPSMIQKRRQRTGTESYEAIKEEVCDKREHVDLEDTIAKIRQPDPSKLSLVESGAVDELDNNNNVVVGVKKESGPEIVRYLL